MGEELTKIMNERASKSKDPQRYVEIAKQLYRLMELSDEDFINDMKW